MKLSAFIATVSWASLFALTWSALLGYLEVSSLTISSFVWFLIVAVISSVVMAGGKDAKDKESK